MIYKCQECGWQGKNPIHTFCRVCAATVEEVIEKEIVIQELEEPSPEITTDEDTQEESYPIKPIYYLE